MVKKPRWIVSGAGGTLEIEADSDTEARRKYMIERYGFVKDNVTPHAPDYCGQGLTVRQK
jgi:hypothetical protein